MMMKNMTSLVVIIMVVKGIELRGILLFFSQLVLELLVILGCSNLGDHPLH